MALESQIAALEASNAALQDRIDGLLVVIGALSTQLDGHAGDPHAHHVPANIGACATM